MQFTALNRDGTSALGTEQIEIDANKFAAELLCLPLDSSRPSRAGRSTSTTKALSKSSPKNFALAGKRLNSESGT